MTRAEHNADEQLVWVDTNDEVLGPVSRAEAHVKALLHRAVHILLFSPDERLWLQKRSAGKSMNPGRWTSTASGHVAEGQDYREAATREVSEELGIQAPPGMELVGKGIAEARNETAGEVCKAWTAVYTGQLPAGLCRFDLRSSEIDRVQAFPLEDVVAALSGKRQLVDSFGLAVSFADNFGQVIQIYLGGRGDLQ